MEARPVLTSGPVLLLHGHPGVVVGRRRGRVADARTHVAADLVDRGRQGPVRDRAVNDRTAVVVLVDVAFLVDEEATVTSLAEGDRPRVRGPHHFAVVGTR